VRRPAVDPFEDGRWSKQGNDGPIRRGDRQDRNPSRKFEIKSPRPTASSKALHVDVDRRPSKPNDVPRRARPASSLEATLRGGRSQTCRPPRASLEGAPAQGRPSRRNIVESRGAPNGRVSAPACAYDPARRLLFAGKLIAPVRGPRRCAQRPWTLAEKTAQRCRAVRSFAVRRSEGSRGGPGPGRSGGEGPWPDRDAEDLANAHDFARPFPVPTVLSPRTSRHIGSPGPSVDSQPSARNAHAPLMTLRPTSGGEGLSSAGKGWDEGGHIRPACGLNQAGPSHPRGDVSREFARFNGQRDPDLRRVGVEKRDNVTSLRSQRCRSTNPGKEAEGQP